ncbi:unnamed protein product [Sphagnum jensenii]|uniref:Fungal lipase-type domain-containing protein n=1 Tax=Sphagnum jensenii TaxID=128206 RepID=A0ABP1A3V9_9BRYO
MSSTSIRLGSNDDRTLRRDDLSRAFFCSVAVYESSTEEAEILFRKTQSEHPAVRFAKVHMSLNLPGEQKFLVAYADDAIFIAFRGTTTLEDIAANLKVANHSGFGGAFHSGFFKRTDVFFQPNCDPMPGLFSLQKRIIFCGHSLGGAVAHMVLLRLLVENNLNTNDEEFALGGIVTFVGRCIDGYTHGGFLQGVSAALMATFDIGRSKFALTLSNTTFVQRLLELLAQQAAHMPRTSNYNQPDFYPIGYYIFIEKQSTAGYGRDHIRFNVHRIDDQSVDMMRKLQDVRFGYEDFEYHKLQSYKMVLIKSDLMDSAQVDSIQRHNFQINNVVSTPTPIVSAPSLQSEKLYPILMEGTPSEKGNDMTKAVADFLSSGLEVSYKRTVAGWAIVINMSIAPAVLAICVSVPIAAAVSAGLGGIASYSAKELSKFRVDDYKKILAIGCEEASKWITSELTSPVDANSENDVLEKELGNRG